NPQAGLTLSGGVLYGTTHSGGSSNSGTVFKVNTDGTSYSVLKSFSEATYDISTGFYTNDDGANPRASLTLSGNVLYGTTYAGSSSGAGTIFKVNTDGTDYTVLRQCNFNDGCFPSAGLILLGSVLYGATSQCGGSSGVGVLFKLNTDGSG